MKSKINKKKIIIILAIIFVLILIAEIVLQITNTPYISYRLNPFFGFEGEFSLFHETKDSNGKNIYQIREGRLGYFNNEKFTKEKPEDVFRIFCFGGSATYGFPFNGTVAFPEWLQVNLDLLESKKQFEVVNVGGISLGSGRITKLTNEMIKYNPDLFIYYIGQDEFLEENLNEEFQNQKKHQPSLFSLINNVKIITLINELFNFTQVDSSNLDIEEISHENDVLLYFGAKAGLDSINRNRLDEKNIIENFGNNLKSIVEISKLQNIKLLFTTVPCNIWEVSPFLSFHKKNLTEADQEKWEKLYLKGRILQKHQRYKEALIEYQRCLEIDDQFAELSFRIAQCMVEVKQGPLAERYFQLARDLDSAFLRPTNDINQMIIKVGETNEIPVFDVESVLETRDLDSFQKAQRFIDHIHTTIPGNQIIAETLVQFMLDNKIIFAENKVNKNVLANAFGKALRVVPDNNLIKGILRISKILEKVNRKEELKTILERNKEISLRNAEYNFMLGNCLLDDSNFNEAIYHFEKAIESDPEYSEAFIKQAEALIKSGSPEAAMEKIQKVIEFDPQDYKAHASKGRIYYLRQDFETAITEYEMALRLNPGYAAAHGEIGTIYYHYQNDARHAVKELQRAIELDSNYTEAFYNLGLINLDNNDIDAAILYFNKALKIDPFYDIAYSSLGVCYYRSKMLNEAREMLELAILIKPRSGRSHNNLAAVYYGSGSYDLALHHANLAKQYGYGVSPELFKAIQEEKEQNK